MPGRTLAETVFVTDPKTHGTLLLTAGTEVTDPAVAEQITHPDAWVPEPTPVPEPRPQRAPRRTRDSAESEAA